MTMKALKCVGFAVLYAFAGIGFATFRTEDHHDIIRMVAACATGFCWGSAATMSVLSGVYFVVPDLGQDEEKC